MPGTSWSPCPTPCRPRVTAPGTMRHNRSVLPPVGDRFLFRAKRRPAVLAAALLAGTAVVGVLLTGWASGGKSGQTDVAGNAGAVLYSAGHRPLAPDFTATTLTGVPLDFASDRGQVVVFNFWVSWCAPCRSEAPVLAVAAQQYRSAGVSFLGVDVRDTATSALAFTRNFGVSYPS